MKTGIQACPCENREPVEETWIPRINCGAGPACAGMTAKERERVRSISTRQYVEEPIAFEAKIV